MIAKKKEPNNLSTLYLSLFPTPIVHSIVSYCVLGYGWKRLDFDT
jgi:hypothetical protein